MARGWMAKQRQTLLSRGKKEDLRVFYAGSAGASVSGFCPAWRCRKRMVVVVLGGRSLGSAAELASVIRCASAVRSCGCVGFDVEESRHMAYRPPVIVVGFMQRFTSFQRRYKEYLRRRQPPALLSFAPRFDIHHSVSANKHQRVRSCCFNAHSST